MSFTASTYVYMNRHPQKVDDHRHTQKVEDHFINVVLGSRENSHIYIYIYSPTKVKVLGSRENSHIYIYTVRQKLKYSAAEKLVIYIYIYIYIQSD